MQTEDVTLSRHVDPPGSLSSQGQEGEELSKGKFLSAEMKLLF